jgi:diaminopimelate decarboxylase
MFQRPPGFEYRKGELHCERVPLQRLAEKYGTPLYVYSAAALKQRYRTFDRAFRETPHTICYSVKASSNLGLLRILGGMGAGFDIVSGGELERVRAASPKAVRKIVFSGVGKTAEELRLALRAGILLFNVESEAELDLLAECAARLKKSASMALRVNPDVPAETHPYISTGLRQHKFGVPMEEAPALYRRAAAHRFLKVAGISLHIGSQITDVSPFALAIERSVALIRQLAGDGHAIRFLDAGGGLGISYASAEPLDLATQAGRYAQAITAPLQMLGKNCPHLLLEPGRSIIAPAGALLTRVLFTKHNGNKRFTVVDAAMNDLLRPALYGARHEITAVSRTAASDVDIHGDVVGPVCESADFLARDVALPPAEAGDLLCVLDAGAYGMSLSSNYNTRPRAAELLVEGARARVIRRRETVKDLLKLEIACL